MQKTITLLLLCFLSLTINAQQTQGIPCTIPTGLTSSNITNVSAIVSWSSNPGALSYDVQYRQVGQVAWINAGNVVAPTTSTTISGLTPVTNYEFQVQSRCAGNVLSGYSVSATFTTLCTIQQSFFYNSSTNTVCINANQVLLQAYPAGGTFGGTGVSGNYFVPANAGTGTHTVTYYPANNCFTPSTITFTVNAPAAPAEPTGITSLCADGPNSTFTIPAVNGATGYSWVFSPQNAGTLINNGNGSATIDWDAAFCGVASLSVNVTTSCGTSTYSAEHLVTVYCTPEPTITPMGLFCIIDQNYTLTSNTQGGVWTPSDVFNPSVAGLGQHDVVYTITQNGCSADDTISLFVQQAIEVNANTQLAAITCQSNFPLTVVGTPDFGSYSPSPFIDTTIPGEYIFTYSISSLYGCSGSDTDTITVIPTPVASFTTTLNCLEVCINNLSVGDSAVLVDWGDGFTGAFSNCHVYPDSGIYCITLSVTNQCGTDDTTICITTPCIVNALTENPISNLNFYPNPTNGLLNVFFTSTTAQNYQLNVVDITGKVLYTEHLNNFTGQYNNPLDMSGYAQGMYFFSITTDTGRAVVKKIVRE